MLLTVRGYRFMAISRPDLTGVARASVIHRIEPFGGQTLDGFSCGNTELNDWLVRHAHTATGQGTRTYLLVDDDGRVLGYFAVAPHLLNRGDAPRRLARGAPHGSQRFPLAKFALDASEQGQGLGSEFLSGTLSAILTVARQVGGRVVAVHAIDSTARSFYRRHHFEAVPTHPRRVVNETQYGNEGAG